MHPILVSQRALGLFVVIVRKLTSLVCVIQVPHISGIRCFCVSVIWIYSFLQLAANAALGLVSIFYMLCGSATNCTKLIHLGFIFLLLSLIGFYLLFKIVCLFWIGCVFQPVLKVLMLFGQLVVFFFELVRLFFSHLRDFTFAMLALIRAIINGFLQGIRVFIIVNIVKLFINIGFVCIIFIHLVQGFVYAIFETVFTIFHPV